MTLHNFGVKYYLQRFRNWAVFLFCKLSLTTHDSCQKKYFPRGISEVTWFEKSLKMSYEYSETLNRRSMNNLMVKTTKDKNTCNGRQIIKQKTKDSASPDTQRLRGWTMRSRRVSISCSTKVNLILVIYSYVSLTCFFILLSCLCGVFINLCKSPERIFF